jgi:hypothetical protein
MSHDKIRAAARKRMAETGEPYAAARRAVVREHQAAGDQIPPAGAGYALRMSGEIHRYPEAVLAAADMLRLVRAGQAPEASAYTYDGERSFLAEFAPGGTGAGSSSA